MCIIVKTWGHKCLISVLSSVLQRLPNPTNDGKINCAGRILWGQVQFWFASPSVWTFRETHTQPGARSRLTRSQVHFMSSACASGLLSLIAVCKAGISPFCLEWKYSPGQKPRGWWHVATTFLLLLYIKFEHDLKWNITNVMYFLQAAKLPFKANSD